MLTLHTVEVLLRVLHVGAGTIAFVVAPAAMFTLKGGEAHRRWGKVYLFAILGLTLTALLLLYFAEITLFLLGISVLSLHLAFSGWRTLARKQRQQAHWYDWAAALLTFAFGVGMTVYAAQGLLGAREMDSIMIVLSGVFGLFTLLAGGRDLRVFIWHPVDTRWWWYAHMAGMIGSYIAIATAFLVQQANRFLSGDYVWLVWVVPSVLSTVAFYLWVWYYKRVFAGRSPLNTIAHTQQPN